MIRKLKLIMYLLKFIIYEPTDEEAKRILEILDELGRIDQD